MPCFPRPATPEWRRKTRHRKYLRVLRLTSPLRFEPTPLLDEFASFLEAKSVATVDGYRRVARQLLAWLAERPGNADGFHPDQLTRTAVETYLAVLAGRGASVSHRARVKSAVSAFATFLIEEKDWLRRNPTRGILLPAQALLAPRTLSADQRYALRSVVEREGSPRGAALFALGYWAGCRVSDAAWLRMADARLTHKAGWIHVGYKGGKTRDIDLVNDARRALDQYLDAECERVPPPPGAYMQAEAMHDEGSRPQMSEPSASQGLTTATQAQTQESQPDEPAPKWGELPPPKRVAELEVRLAAWAQLPTEARGDPAMGEGRSAFDREGPQGWKSGPLTGADVFYLAARSLAGGSAEPEAPEAAAVRLRTASEVERHDFDLSTLHLEGADLSHALLKDAILREAHLEGAALTRAHLEGANLSLAHLEGANLSFASLEDASLGAAYLADADLHEANLERARLGGASLQGADLIRAHLERALLRAVSLERAALHGAHLDGVLLEGARLAGADVTEAHLEGADVTEAHLEGANLSYAHLEGAALTRAHLEGANLALAHLERALLIGASFDKISSLNEAVLTGASFDQVIFDNTNLTVVDWSQVGILGDERTAHERKRSDGKPKSRQRRLTDYKAAVRANRVLAVSLQAQGLSEDAARFAYRAQLLQRQVLLRQFRLPQYGFSWLLDGLAGYGFRPGRTLFWYLVTISSFAFMYMRATMGWIPFGLPAPSTLAPLPWYEALILSVSSFHGRGFFQPIQSLGDPVAALAAIEAVIGLLIEISFIATFTQRYFSVR